jgi:hypothetical protein
LWLPTPEFLEAQAIAFPLFFGKKNFAVGPLLNFIKGQKIAETNYSGGTAGLGVLKLNCFRWIMVIKFRNSCISSLPNSGLLVCITGSKTGQYFAISIISRKHHCFSGLS